MLFRQQRDESRSRGYFQKALVIVSDLPYVDLYDRVLRVTGPLFFTAGAQVLQAVYDGIHRWCALAICLLWAEPEGTELIFVGIDHYITQASSGI